MIHMSRENPLLTPLLSNLPVFFFRSVQPSSVELLLPCSANSTGPPCHPADSRHILLPSIDIIIASALDRGGWVRKDGMAHRKELVGWFVCHIKCTVFEGM